MQIVKSNSSKEFYGRVLNAREGQVIGEYRDMADKRLTLLIEVSDLMQEKKDLLKN